MTIVTSMGAAIKLDECYDEPSGERLPPRARAENSNSYGGNVDEILKRLGTVESAVTGIAAITPHLATKADIHGVRVEVSELRAEVRGIAAELKADVGGIAAIIPHLATKADLNAVRGEINAMQGNMSALEVRLLKWMVPTVIASAGLIFTITKYVH